MAYAIRTKKVRLGIVGDLSEGRRALSPVGYLGYASDMGKKGGKSMRGQAETDWGEPKTARLSADMTPTGRDSLKVLAEELGLSVAEMLERLARREPVIEDRRLIEFAEACRVGRSVDDLMLVELAHDLDVDTGLLIDLRDCLQERWRAKNAAERS